MNKKKMTYKPKESNIVKLQKYIIKKDKNDKLGKNI